MLPAKVVSKVLVHFVFKFLKLIDKVLVILTKVNIEVSTKQLTTHKTNTKDRKYKNITLFALLSLVPAQMQTEDRTWYSGTADAIYQNVHLIEDFKPDQVAVFGGDHIYRMDISQMVDFHIEKNAIATVAAIPVPTFL